jgi:inositol transport system permease protein
MKEIIKPNLRKYSLVLILLGMIGICSILSSSFLTATNFTNILKQVSIVTICAFAQGLIIISGEIDLSIGFLAGMAGSFACIMFVATGNLFLAFMFGLLL